jgi:hypothetical protein
MKNPMTLMFQKFDLSSPDFIYQHLSQVLFEDITRGRKGAILVDIKDELIPLVRSTTKYESQPQSFQPIHYLLMDRCREINPDFIFNNAMIELYDDQYRTMKAHSDQAQDLEPDSYIAIFSCYSSDESRGLRKLKVEHKITKEQFEITLDNMSLVIFSINTNTHHLHKIVLDDPHDNQWLGLTFRKSKTMIQMREGVAYFAGTERVLKLATKEQSQQYYKYRSTENREIGYVYPDLDYTIA